jgi:hypothetical protein
MLNNSGPKIEPWGTPQIKDVDAEEQFPTVTEKLLSKR